MKFEDEFEDFQERLRGGGDSDLLWRLRDSIYCSAYYVETGERTQRRHAFGIPSWLASHLASVLKPRPGGNGRPSVKPARIGFLFFGWHDSHFRTLLPIVHETARHEPVVALTIALKPDQISILRGIDGVHIQSLEGWSRELAPSAADRIRDAVTAIRVARRFLAMPQWEPHERSLFTSRGSRLVECIYEFLTFRRIWREQAAILPTSALFVTSESSPLAKALVDQMRQSGGRRVIHMAHGFRSSTHQVTQATDFCVYNAVEQGWYASRVPHGTVVRTLGIPRLETIRDQVGPPRERPEDEPFRLLFFSQGTSTDYTPAMRREDLAILSSRGSRVPHRIRVRPHPLESVERLREDLAAVGVTVDELGNHSIEEDLTWCDVAATSSSTALMEAAVTHRICYWTNARADRIAAVEELWEMGVGKLIRSNDEWMEEARKIMSGTVTEPALVPEEKLRSLRVLPRELTPWSQRLGL